MPLNFQVSVADIDYIEIILVAVNSAIAAPQYFAISPMVRLASNIFMSVWSMAGKPFSDVGALVISVSNTLSRRRDVLRTVRYTVNPIKHAINWLF